MDLSNKDKYKEKYLKYKIKYILLKQIGANDVNKNNTEDEFKRKYLKYKRKYIELKQIGAYSNDKMDEKMFYHKRYYNIIYFLISRNQVKSVKKILSRMHNRPDFTKLVKKKKTEQILTINNNKVTAITAKNAKNLLRDQKIFNSKTSELDRSLRSQEWEEYEIIEKANENAEATEEKAYEIFEKWLEENENDKRNIMIVMGFVYDKTEGVVAYNKGSANINQNFATPMGVVKLKTVKITIKR